MRFSLFLVFAMLALLALLFAPQVALAVPGWAMLVLCVVIVVLIRRRLPPQNVSH